MTGSDVFTLARSGERLPLEHPRREALFLYGARLGIVAAIVLLNLAALPLLYAAVWFVWRAGFFGAIVALAGLAIGAIGVTALIGSVQGAHQSTAIVRGAVDELKEQQGVIARHAGQVITRTKLRDEIQGIVDGMATVTQQLDRAGQALGAAAERPLEQYEHLSAQLDRAEAAQRSFGLEAAQQQNALAQLLRDLAERHSAQDQRIAQALERLERTIESSAGAYARQATEQAALIDESQRLMASMTEATSRLAAAMDLARAPEEAAPRAPQAAQAARTEGEAIADLGLAYRLRYERSGDTKDLELAIQYTGEALEVFRRTGKPGWR